MKRWAYVLLTMIMCVGCQHISKTKPAPTGADIYGIPSAYIILDSYENINKKFKEYSDLNIDVDAFTLPNQRIIWVQRNKLVDKDGEVLPDFFTLGHEIWHLVKKDFHDPTDTRYSKK